MSNPITLELTHAVIKKPIAVLASQLFSFYYSDTQNATILLSIGQTAIPVMESPDVIKLQLSRLQEQNNSRVLHEAQGLQAGAPAHKAGV